jgi:hypothetical protein
MRKQILIFALSLLLIPVCRVVAVPIQEPQLSEDEIKRFLLNAKVIAKKVSNKGITNTLRLTLSDGKITHDASFQSIDERRSKFEGMAGGVELNFVDSYKYNIAAFELAKLVGLGDMVPVTVLRKYEGKSGSLSWWLPVTLDELDRQKKKISPHDVEAYNRQMHKQRVFAELVYDMDRNLTNILYSSEWHMWMIDFCRAFRLFHDLKTPKNLEKCERRLFENLRTLDRAELAEKTKGFLTRPEVDGVMARRDKIVKLFEKLIAEKGEKEVLY